MKIFIDEVFFNKHETLEKLRHYLPSQAPLKDFVHHNTLHGFQHLKFEDAIRYATEVFGYKASLNIKEYREIFHKGKISDKVLDKIILREKGPEDLQNWRSKLIEKEFNTNIKSRIGALRNLWKKDFHIDLDNQVHPLLFKLLCSYLDQGISIWQFPSKNEGFIASLIEIEKNSYSSIFRSKEIKNLFVKNQLTLEDLLENLVGEEKYFEQYLFDQQFSHPGWSGMVAVIEKQPETLLESRNITLEDLIKLECYLELDALNSHYANNWAPLTKILHDKVEGLFMELPYSEYAECLKIWQEAYEWTFYDLVISGLQYKPSPQASRPNASFQAMFCIDDRECSFRRYLEQVDTLCSTYGTPGFFGVDIYYQPMNGHFHTKVCPGPVTPRHLVKEYGEVKKQKTDIHFTKLSHNFFSGWLITQTLGFWSALKLFMNVFKPSMSPAVSHSFKHMDRLSKLTIENINDQKNASGLQIGFKINEMADRVEGVLKSIGLTDNFAPLVYTIGHGASTTNNPHYAAYDCGACSGRAGSVNARVFSYMANKAEVRELLRERGIHIPNSTYFIGGLRDTTRDEIDFYDVDALPVKYQKVHEKNLLTFEIASDLNAKERSRRFKSISSQQSAKEIHKEILTRSVSLFEPRPELNHATNALCIVGKRELTKGLFLDRRAFLNSYDYQQDPDGKYLLNILNAATPVCGGINLEYYFSKVENQKLGAGSKLPHNVMGLIGVSNGIEGDLRTGLPSQMIEVHDPIRLMMVVEQYPEVVLDTIKRNTATYEWYINNWVNLVAIEPETKKAYRFQQGEFSLYELEDTETFVPDHLESIIESSDENLPVYLLKAS